MVLSGQQPDYPTVNEPKTGNEFLIVTLFEQIITSEK
jgi:hypothetical protein